MVCILKLIFNNNYPICSSFRCIDINVEISHAGLGLINDYFQADRICQ